MFVCRPPRRIPSQRLYFCGMCDIKLQNTLTRCTGDWRFCYHNDVRHTATIVIIAFVCWLTFARGCVIFLIYFPIALGYLLSLSRNHISSGNTHTKVKQLFLTSYCIIFNGSAFINISSTVSDFDLLTICRAGLWPAIVHYFFIEELYVRTCPTSFSFRLLICFVLLFIYRKAEPSCAPV